MKKYVTKHPDIIQAKPENIAAVVPEIQGKAKHGNAHANPIIAGTHAPSLKVYHSVPHSIENNDNSISEIYPVIDNDIARDNIENDLTAADLQDL